MLEARAAGEPDFHAVGDPVDADADGYVHAEVSPTVRTQYRWSAPDTGYADASVSGVVTVRPR